MRKWIGALLVALAACGGAESSGPILSAAGVYGLSTIDGNTVPFYYQDSLQVYGGAITLNADSTFQDVLKYDYVYAGLKATTTDTLSGLYRVVGSSIQFAGNGGVSQAGYDGTQITFSTGRVWIYRR